MFVLGLCSLWRIHLAVFMLNASSSRSITFFSTEFQVSRTCWFLYCNVNAYELRGYCFISAELTGWM